MYEYVCMFVCMYVCMHICMHQCIYKSMYVSVDLSIYLSIYLPNYLLTFIWCRALLYAKKGRHVKGTFPQLFIFLLLKDFIPPASYSIWSISFLFPLPLIFLALLFCMKISGRFPCLPSSPREDDINDAEYK